MIINNSLNIFCRKCSNNNRKIQSDKLREKQLSKSSCITLNILHRAVETRVIWAERWLQELILSNFSTLDSAGYRQFTQVLYSSLYTTVVQGRPLAVSTLCLRDGNELLIAGVTLSNQFKTREKFGYQPVIANNSSMTLLNAYITQLRPQICAAAEENDEGSPLFLKYDGTPLKDLGREVTRFFKSQLGVHITTNTIRSLVETASEKLKNRGLISGEDRVAISNVNGHSGRTAMDYYVQQNRITDARLSNNVFQQIIGVDSNYMNHNEDVAGFVGDHPDFIVSNEVADFSYNGNTSVATESSGTEWGSAHPNFGQRVGRARWTEIEISAVGNWCATKIRETPALRKQIVKHCFEYFTTNGRSSVEAIFHPLHIESATRLRHGFRIAAQLPEYAILNNPLV